MIEGLVLVIVLIGLPYAAWRFWLAFFPGISLNSDYGIRGGWFGTKVSFKSISSSLWRFVSS